MNYLIAVYADRVTAEEAYTTLKSSEVPADDVTILGEGHNTADEFGFIDPAKVGKKQATLMSYWLVPFGFFGGFVFDYITGLNTFDWAGNPGNHIVGGLAGAIAGGMGSFFVGNSMSMMTGGGDALPFRNRLNAGDYLVIYRYEIGKYRDLANRILRDYKPDTIQGYIESGGSDG